MKKLILVLGIMVLTSLSASAAAPTATRYNHGGGYIAKITVTSYEVGVLGWPQLTTRSVTVCHIGRTEDRAIWSPVDHEFIIFRWIDGECREIDRATALMDGVSCRKGPLPRYGDTHIGRWRLSNSGWTPFHTSCPPTQTWE